MSTDEKADEPRERNATEERFYVGWLEKLYPGAQLGVVRSGAGREIPFDFAHVVMVGPARRFEDLKVGMRIGFDVGWTSRGLRVTVIRAGE